MKKNDKKSVEKQIKVNNICCWIMAIVVVFYAIIMVVDMVSQRAIDPMQSTMIACMGCLIACVGSNTKKLKDEAADKEQESEE